MNEIQTQRVNETSDQKQPALISLIVSILSAVSNALQIPNYSCVPTCRKSSGRYSALSIVVSSKPFTIERQRAVRRPWQPPVVEENQQSSKEC